MCARPLALTPDIMQWLQQEVIAGLGSEASQNGNGKTLPVHVFWPDGSVVECRVPSDNGHSPAAAGYARVSGGPGQRDGWSIQTQIRSLCDEASREGFFVRYIFVDFMSGGTDDRPQFQRMIDYAGQREFERLYAFHTSRFARDVIDPKMVKRLLRDQLDIEAHFLNQPYIDPNTPEGFLIESINEVFDEHERLKASFFTKRNKRQRVLQGIYNGVLPVGYRRADDPKERVPVPDPDGSAAVKLAFERYATGQFSDREIADILNAAGHKTRNGTLFTKDSVRSILKNPFYTGQITYCGETFPGRQPPIISEEFFEQVQAARRHRRRLNSHAFTNKPTYRIYLLNTRIHCAICGRRMRCSTTNGNRYYREMSRERGYEDCVVSGRSAPCDQIEEQLASILCRFSLQPSWRERVQELVNSLDERATALDWQEQLKAQMNKLTKAWVRNAIDEATYERELEAIQRELGRLVIPESSAVIEAADYLDSLGEIWEAATMVEKRDIVRTVIQRAYCDPLTNELTGIIPYPPFRPLSSALPGLVEVTAGLFCPAEIAQSRDLAEIRGPNVVADERPLRPEAPEEKFDKRASLG